MYITLQEIKDIKIDASVKKMAQLYKLNSTKNRREELESANQQLVQIEEKNVKLAGEKQHQEGRVSTRESYINERKIKYRQLQKGTADIRRINRGTY